LAHAEKWFPYIGAKIVASLRIENYYKNVSKGEIVNPDVKKNVEAKIKVFSEAIHAPAKVGGK
jgi:hypothetical protein